MGEGSVFPVDGAEDDGDDAGLIGLVALQGFLHFDAVAVVGVEEVSADEQQDDVRVVEVGVDFVFPGGAGKDDAVVLDFEPTARLRLLR